MPQPGCSNPGDQQPTLTPCPPTLGRSFPSFFAGEEGPKGPDGPVGAPGENGRDGHDAPEGTVALLKGDRGEPGDPGGPDYGTVAVRIKEMAEKASKLDLESKDVFEQAKARTQEVQRLIKKELVQVIASRNPSIKVRASFPPRLCISWPNRLYL